MELMQEKARAKARLNRKHAKRAVHSYDGLFPQMNGLLANLTNITSDSVCVYLKLFSVTNANQQRLVRSKISRIFKSSMREALNLNVLDSFRIFGGDSIF